MATSQCVILADVSTAVPADSIIDRELVQVSESFGITAVQMIAIVREHGLEGVVAKRPNSRYESGRRSGAWQKLCLTQAQEL